MDNEMEIKKENMPINQSGRGREENITQEDIEIPRAKLIQTVSDEATTEKVEERVMPGKIINSITKEELPEIFIPIFRYINWIRWNPRKKSDPNYDPAYDLGAVVFRSSDPNDPQVIEGSKFGPGGEPPAVTKYLNFFSLFPGHPMPVVVSFAKTSFAAGQRLNSLDLFYNTGGGDMFSRQYKLRSVQREAEGTKYFVLDVAPAGTASKEDFTIAEQWWNQFRGKSIKEHQESPEK